MRQQKNVAIPPPQPLTCSTRGPLFRQCSPKSYRFRFDFKIDIIVEISHLSGRLEPDRWRSRYELFSLRFKYALKTIVMSRSYVDIAEHMIMPEPQESSCCGSFRTRRRKSLACHSNRARSKAPLSKTKNMFLQDPVDCPSLLWFTSSIILRKHMVIERNEGRKKWSRLTWKIHKTSSSSQSRP